MTEIPTELRIPQPEPVANQRKSRGEELWAARKAEIVSDPKSRMWTVPSASDSRVSYQVRITGLDLCECADFSYRRPMGGCIHIWAARKAKEVSTYCECCGNRVPWCKVSEVMEEDGLLSWFVGQRICYSCVEQTSP